MSYIELFLKRNLKLREFKKSSQFRTAIKWASREVVELLGRQKTHSLELENLGSSVELASFHYLIVRKLFPQITNTYLYNKNKNTQKDCWED